MRINPAPDNLLLSIDAVLSLFAVFMAGAITTKLQAAYRRRGDPPPTEPAE